MGTYYTVSKRVGECSRFDTKEIKRNYSLICRDLSFLRYVLITMELLLILILDELKVYIKQYP